MTGSTAGTPNGRASARSLPAAGDQPPKLLANMHGGWFDFPIGFRAADTSGLRPIGSYLKVTGDFTGYDGRIVFGCDDAAKSHFLAGLGLHSDMNLVGQSNSNLWFSNWDDLFTKGGPVGWGGWWMDDNVAAGQASAAFLFHGYRQRVLHLSHATDQDVTFPLGDLGRTRLVALVDLRVAPAAGYAFHVFPADAPGQWIRATTDRDAVGVTAYFHYGLSQGSEIRPGVVRRAGRCRQHRRAQRRRRAGPGRKPAHAACAGDEHRR
jgi:hypothetical protein